MLEGINLPLIIGASMIGALSPGPATLAIAGTSMNAGRKYGMVLAVGISTASIIWALSAMFGLAALMQTNAWMFEIVRYLGACYLMFLAYKSLRSAIKPSSAKPIGFNPQSLKAAYFKGLAVHLTNPKAILFFGSLVSIGVPATAPVQSVAIVMCIVVGLGFTAFQGYAILFSSARITASYIRLRRWFEGAFALAFGAAGAKILTTSLISVE
ncbi:MAG: LysE family translocator [Cohaesibacteraceae bacterium]|nr:LysE family translocator [Cohaesibacteraceae bacterium]